MTRPCARFRRGIEATGITHLAPVSKTGYASLYMEIAKEVVHRPRKGVRTSCRVPPAVFDAKVAKLADAPDLGSGSRKAMGVQIPPFAPLQRSPLPIKGESGRRQPTCVTRPYCPEPSGGR